jgi:chemotaxis protein methyltransferase CheR
MSLEPDDLAVVFRLANEVAGIQWDESKIYLVESRLSGLPAKYQCKTLAEFLRLVKLNDAAARNAFIDAITTRETTFFRDQAPFQALEYKVLPEVIDGKQSSIFPRRLRLWSAACSSGQEPYSMAMTIARLVPDFEEWDILIYATDISDAAIATASRGFYTDFEMDRGIPAEQRDAYFEKQPGGWKVRDEIRSLVRFERRNLMDPFTGLANFDVIFCRNVAIYFDPLVRDKLFRRLADVLHTDGTLFAGHAERLDHIGPEFASQTHCRTAYYQPRKITATRSLAAQRR